MLTKLKTAWMRFFYAQCYAFCKSNAYLAYNRGEHVVAADWASKAHEWHLLWWKTGRSLK